jgi:hypothetical protein
LTLRLLDLRHAATQTVLVDRNRPCSRAIPDWHLFRAVISRRLAGEDRSNVDSICLAPPPSLTGPLFLLPPPSLPIDGATDRSLGSGLSPPAPSLSRESKAATLGSQSPLTRPSLHTPKHQAARPPDEAHTAVSHSGRNPGSNPSSPLTGVGTSALMSTCF